MADADARLTRDEAIGAINALRSNVIGTQVAGWSNLMYPLVAILNAAGLDYIEPSDEQMREHMDCYGGAGGFPGNVLREPQRGWCEPIGRRKEQRLALEHLVAAVDDCRTHLTEDPAITVLVDALERAKAVLSRG